MTTYHVALEGDDAWTGRIPHPNQDRSDGPFATIERARDEIRRLRTSGGTLPVEVLLGGGRYERVSAFELGPEDSGTRRHPVIYRSYDDNPVVISGGRTVTNFKPLQNSVALDRLPVHSRAAVIEADLQELGLEDLGAVDEAGRRIELFHSDSSMPLARYPNDGFMTIGDVTGDDPSTVHGIDGDRTGIFTCDDSRLSDWSREKDIRLHGYWFWDWSDAFAGVERLEPERNEIEVAKPYHNYGYRPGQRFYALNLLCELDAPGEWYIDRETSSLYFWPPEDNTEGDSVLSVAQGLVAAVDARWITFQDITFECCRGNALEVSGGVGVRVDRCRIQNTGAWGIRVEGGYKHSVTACTVIGTGEGGVYLNGGDRPSLTAAGHEAVNNHVTDFGRLYRTYRPAFGIEGVGNRVAHNQIHNGPHNAIQLRGNDHVVEFNEVYDVCYETGDVGAFYMGRDWTEQGVVIRNNHFHDIQGPGLHGAMAVYLDDAASGVTILGNVFQRASRAAFIGGGRHNRVAGNIFVDCSPSIHIDARGLGWMRNHVVEGGILPERLEAMPWRQPLWTERYPQLSDLVAGDPGEPVGNVIEGNLCAGGDWTEIEEIAGKHAIISGNQVRPDSESLQKSLRASGFRPIGEDMGISPLPFHKIGLFDTGNRDGRGRIISAIDSSWYEHLDVPDRVACGGIVGRRERDQVMIALVKEREHPLFVLPKGGVETGESLEEGAMREIHEESGLQHISLVKKLDILERLNYRKSVWSVVHMYLFITSQLDGIPTDQENHFGVWWFSLDTLPPMFWPEQEKLIKERREEIETEILAV